MTMEKNNPASPGRSQRQSLIYVTLTALFAGLIGAGTFIALPLPGSPVPIVLQNMFALLAGLILGPALGAASAGLFLLAGILGAPVFAGASGGIARLLGPTGGFLAGYPLMAATAGLIAGTPRPDRPTSAGRLILGIAAGLASVYVPGLIRLKFALDYSWPETVLAGCLPFLPGDAIKGLAAGCIAPRLRRAAAEHLHG
ncbi:MAG: biotin transporter BioY [Spirochaetaceae bacterium]|jgi:biotin transport system substrate-specific component|nr:biotin transporter BioY [Spirochaetaceae bacterium]